MSGAPFPTTQWSQVAVAFRDGDVACSALDSLCQRYWRPVYSFIRHSGRSSHDAEDITQAFFAQIIESGYIQKADREKGRFRTFLIVHLKYFLSNDRRKELAQKRGGGAVHLPIDVEWAESKLEWKDARQADPDAYFDRQWALEVVRHARAEVSEQYAAKGKSALFEALKAGLAKTPDAAQYAKWERELEMSPGNLRVALHRLRDRFREAIEGQILDTISEEADFKEEMRYLRRALGHSME